MKQAYSVYTSVLVGCVLWLSSTTAFAWQYTITPVSDFSGWSDPILGGAVQVSSSGKDDWTGVTTDLKDDGFFANLRVDSMVCPSYCQTSLGRYVGIYQGYHIRADIRLASWNSGEQQFIEYRLSAYDENYTYVKRLARGTFGGFKGEHYWKVGSPVGLAVGIEGDELIFYSSSTNTISKIRLLSGITPYTTPKPFFIGAWTETAADSISATASGFHNVSIK